VKRAQEVVIEIIGMTSRDCERRVAHALAAVPGVSAASASRAEAQAVVTADPAIATPQQLREAVRAAGYDAADVRFPE